MPPDKQRVADLIRGAFRGVELGDGVGLWQGQALDDYGDDQEARKRDEKHDWSKLTVEDLSVCYSSLSFFDAEGMRFHLPAYLLDELRGGSAGVDMVWELTYGYGDRFALLNIEQRFAVHEFLKLRLSQLGEIREGFDGEYLRQAVNEHWKC